MSNKFVTIINIDGAGMTSWAVDFSKVAAKQYEKLKRSGAKPSVNDVIDLLVLDLQRSGP